MERLTGEYKLPSPSYRELLAAHLLFYISNGERSLVAASIDLDINCFTRCSATTPGARSP